MEGPLWLSGLTQGAPKRTATCLETGAGWQRASLSTWSLALGWLTPEPSGGISGQREGRGRLCSWSALGLPWAPRSGRDVCSGTRTSLDDPDVVGRWEACD